MSETTDKELLKPKDFAATYPQLFTLSQLNWLIKTRAHNGFDRCIRKVGQRKIFVCHADVIDWIDQQRG